MVAPIQRPSDRPFVLINMAMTADGKIATANGAVSTFGSARDKRNLLDLRATADAVMAGARTVDAHPVTLGPGGDKYRRRRLRHGLAENNLRIVISGSGSLNPNAAIFKTESSPVIVIASGSASPRKLERLHKGGAAIKQFGDTKIDFPAALKWLRLQHGVRRLLCEGGGELNDALFRAGLVDELHLTVCPIVFGGSAASTISDGLGFEKLNSACALELKSRKQGGSELFLAYRVQRNSGNASGPAV